MSYPEGGGWGWGGGGGIGEEGGGTQGCMVGYDGLRGLNE